jgi:hypothetical protein
MIGDPTALRALTEIDKPLEAATAIATGHTTRVLVAFRHGLRASRIFELT